MLSGPPTGGATGAFCPGPSLKGAPGGPMKGPLNTCLKDRYTLIEQSDLNTLIEQSQYSSEEQCSKLIDKEIWLVMGSYCHCQQAVTFFFFFSSFFFLVFTLQLGSRAPLQLFALGPLISLGGPECYYKYKKMRNFIQSGIIIQYIIALYIRDHGGLGFSGQKYHQKPASQCHPGALAMLVRHNSAKSVFSTTLNASDRLLQIYKKNTFLLLHA